MPSTDVTRCTPRGSRSAPPAGAGGGAWAAGRGAGAAAWPWEAAGAVTNVAATASATKPTPRYRCKTLIVPPSPDSPTTVGRILPPATHAACRGALWCKYDGTGVPVRGSCVLPPWAGWQILHTLTIFRRRFGLFGRRADKRR